MQMVVAAVLVNALHATLEDAEEAFDGVGMHVRINEGNVLLNRMAHDAMISEEAAKAGIAVGVRMGHCCLARADPLARLVVGYVKSNIAILLRPCVTT